MNKLASALLSLPLVACVVGSGMDTADDTGGTGDDGSTPGGTGGTASDHITSDTTWTGAVTVSKGTTVDTGATLTIAAGTTVKFASVGSLTVHGVVKVEGTKASVVQLVPSTTGGHFGGISVPTGGEVKMTYGVQTGGGISVSGGKLTVTDSQMSRASGDFLVVNSGTVVVTYSAIGIEPGGEADTTHCNLHFGSSGNDITVTNSNISGAPYGLMLYGGNNVKLTENNWLGNPIQIDTLPGVSGDVSGSWFVNPGAPSAGGGATLTFSNPAPSRLPIGMAGPR